LKKPSLQFSIPCLEVDESGNKPPSFKYIFYELPFPEFPIKSPNFFINNGWCYGLGPHTERTKILKPDKKTVLTDTKDHEFMLEDDETPFMAINMYQEIVFPEPGTYWVQVFLDNQQVIQYPLPIRQANAKKKV
jgi:hypothetical protein